jgi:16S rRNA (cytosine967-C5)-methyltransferase
MTPAARIQAAIELLREISATPRPADAVASAFFRARRWIGAKDRTAVAESVYAVLRRHARLGWWLERAHWADLVDPRARMIASRLLGDGVRAPALERLFLGGRFGPEPLTPAEIRLVQALDGHTLEHPGMPEAVLAECPAWAEPALRRALGERFAAELAALRGPAPLDLRLNPVRAGARKLALEQLRAAGVRAEPGRWSPLAIRVAGRLAVAELELFRQGAIEIQDEGSQLVALLADARPGQQVVDFCAGAGGKTLAMAAAMANRGRVIACDVLGNRLKRAAERFRRAGLHNIETRPLSGERDPWVKHHKGQFDRVLVDAPCTGTGTWRRNPDARWRPLGPGLDELLPLQAAILDSAARLVKPGGRLIYATCSLLTEENEDQIAGFLAAHPDFVAVSALDLWPQAVGTTPPAGLGACLRLTPARHDTDGFFAAILERKPAPAATAAAAADAPEVIAAAPEPVAS